jgi:hypothetical protein
MHSMDGQGRETANRMRLRHIEAMTILQKGPGLPRLVLAADQSHVRESLRNDSLWRTRSVIRFAQTELAESRAEEREVCGADAWLSV